MSNKESKAGQEGEPMKGCITEQSATMCNGLLNLGGLSPKNNKCLSRPSIAEEKGENIYLSALVFYWSKVNPQCVNYPILLVCTCVGTEWGLVVQCQQGSLW